MHSHRYHLLATGLLLLINFTAILQSSAQVPIPAAKRPIIGGGSSNIGVVPKAPEKPLVKTTTYITFGEARQWTSSEGKPLLAKLIAFEEIVTDSTSASPQTPVLPTTSPTLVKDGKVRLLVNKKPFEIVLDKLSQPDRDFIENLSSAIQKKATAPK